MLKLSEIVTSIVEEYLRDNPPPITNADIHAAAQECLSVVTALPRIADALESIAASLKEIEKPR